MSSKDTRAPELAKEARRVLEIMRQHARRALVLEMTGTPKAGKTTAVTSLKAFFKECGYRVHLLTERAADCPLPMKGHFFFNTWTTCTMMAEVLATVDTNVDLIILDRGYFDALVWLELQHKRGQVSTEEKAAFAAFVMLPRFRELLDTAVVMRVDPETAIQRENAHLIIPRAGSIMNQQSLTEFNIALSELSARYARDLVLIEFNSSTHNVVESSIRLVELLLPRFGVWADPTIAAMPRKTLVDLLGRQSFLRANEARDVWSKLQPTLHIDRRSNLERSSEWVQIIACGVATHDGGVFVFDRSERDKKFKDYGRQVLWKGCHVDSGSPPDLAIVTERLVQRIRQDLHLAIPLLPELMGLVWDESEEQFHVGMMFKVPIHSDDVARSMKEKEFRTSGRYHTTTGTFQKPADLLSGTDLDLEVWSRHLLKEIGVSP